MKVFLHAYYWLLDYLYVAKVQIANLFARDNPLPYAKAGAPPVLLIPGVYETWRFMNPLAEVLHANGYDVHVVEAFKYNTGSVDDMAALALQYVQSGKLHDVTIVTHSKGGLIGKRLLMMTKGSNVFNALVAINAPFSGSFYAYLLPLKSLRLFAPSSKVIKSLAEDVASNKRIVSIYGLFDPHIPGGSKLNGAQNVQLPTYGHFRVLADARVHTAVLNAVAQLKPKRSENTRTVKIFTENAERQFYIVPMTSYKSKSLKRRKTMGFISTKAHTIIGLVVGIALLFAPALFGFTDNEAASMVSMIVGAFIILNEIITTSPYSPFKLVRMKVHIAIDVVTGVFLAVSPWLFGFYDADMNHQWVPHLIVGIMVAGYALLTSTADEKNPDIAEHAVRNS